MEFIKNFIREIQFRILFGKMVTKVKRNIKMLNKEKNILRKIYISVKVMQQKSFLKKNLKNFLMKIRFKYELKKYGLG